MGDLILWDNGFERYDPEIKPYPDHVSIRENYPP
jgi:hypothetical protein